MKGGGFEVINHGALEIIQPHEPWEYSTLRFPALISNNPFPKPIMENQCINTESNELSQWVDHITKQLIDDVPYSGSFMGPTGMINFVSSSDDLRPKKIARKAHVDADVSGNELILPTNNELQVHIENGGTKELIKRVDHDHGLTLITLLFECAAAISDDNLGEAHQMLLELSQMVSPYGPSCAERVVAYFAKAMSSRVINSWLGICYPLINYRSVHATFQVFNNISPFIKFSHFTSNQAILEAFHRRDRVHIIDLDIMQGLQWPALFHILATRIEGPPHVRLTGMGSSMEILVDTGKQLSNFAKRLGMSFEFHPIARKFGEVDASMVQVRHGETLAVHWVQHSLYDAIGPDWKTLRLIQQLRPQIFTLVEQDILHGASFLDRFIGSLHYYSSIFDSLGANFGIDDSSRYEVENCILYREINNILAIGGPSRSGEERFRHWRSELKNYLIQIPMSGNSMAQAQLMLNMFPPGHGYSLVQGEYGTLKLGWKDTCLYTASSWTCSTAAR